MPTEIDKQHTDQVNILTIHVTSAKAGKWQRQLWFSINYKLVIAVEDPT